MKVIKTDDFEKAFGKLPKEIHKLYTVQEERLKENWRDPRLHVKKVRALEFALSFRITRRYRVFFYLQNAETAIFFEIDHHKDIYR